MTMRKNKYNGYRYNYNKNRITPSRKEKIYKPKDHSNRPKEITKEK